MSAARGTGNVASRLLVLAFVLAACNTTVPPIVETVPSPTPPRTTPIPNAGAFAPASYPSDGDAPCGQAKPPDAAHAAYRGELKRIRAKDARTVVFELCRPDVAFLSKIASPAFGINDSAWLTHHVQPGTADPQAIVTEVNGTGPYKVEGWDRGTEISLARYDSYWATSARNERLIVRWSDGSAKRVNELEAGTVDGIDDIDPTGAATIDGDVSLVPAVRPGLNVFYLGFTDTIGPFGNEKIRQALALGIDRQKLVDAFFPPGSELASKYAPCAIPHACSGADWYTFDPALARETLAAAGYPKGLQTTIHYAAAARPYLPDPAGVATELQAQLLANLGIQATLVVEPDDTYLAAIDAGTMPGIYLDGQTATYPDVSAFLDPTFGPRASKAFGTPFADIGRALAAGNGTASGPKRDAAYGKVNDLIRAHVPMIPVARTGSSTAYLADVEGAGASPLGLERFATMTPGDRRQFVWLTSAEPAGLYCADETDRIAMLVCSQVVDSLYTYDRGSAGVVPSLAERCAPNGALTIWTCTLRRGVLFDDGSRLDAGDVLASFAVQWDADNPRHLGRTSTFPTFASWFGGFLHPPAKPAG